jgi:predicted Holliday junction resolvase-like endonuclease
MTLPNVSAITITRSQLHSLQRRLGTAFQRIHDADKIAAKTGDWTDARRVQAEYDALDAEANRLTEKLERQIAEARKDGTYRDDD